MKYALMIIVDLRSTSNRWRIWAMVTPLVIDRSVASCVVSTDQQGDESRLLHLPHDVGRSAISDRALMM